MSWASALLPKAAAAFFCIAFSAVGRWQADGALLSLVPSADTSLMEVAPTNNNGAQEWLLSGTTQNTPHTRALLKFDLAALPSNAVIRAVQVILSVTREPSDGLASAPFGLHRMLRSWTEGVQSSATNPGQGAPAAPGETTWSHRFYPATAWSGPGGAAGVDFVPAQSASQFIYGAAESPYFFETTPEMVADVQGWIRDQSSNFGWMLLCADEGTVFTARRFGSREDPSTPPVLEVTYLVPPRLDPISVETNTVHLRFFALPEHTYEIQAQAAPNHPWQTLKTIPPLPEPTMVTHEEPMFGARFYRVVGR